MRASNLMGPEPRVLENTIGRAKDDLSLKVACFSKWHQFKESSLIIARFQRLVPLREILGGTVHRQKEACRGREKADRNCPTHLCPQSCYGDSALYANLVQRTLNSDCHDSQRFVIDKGLMLAERQELHPTTLIPRPLSRESPTGDDHHGFPARFTATQPKGRRSGLRIAFRLDRSSQKRHCVVHAHLVNRVCRNGPLATSIQ